MTVFIHVFKEKSMQLYGIDEPYHEEEVAFRRSRGSHMEIGNEKQEKMVSSPPHPSTIQREPVEPIDLVDLVDLVDVPRNIVVGRKRLAWACQTL
jgi:hypothetical protein